MTSDTLPAKWCFALDHVVGDGDLPFDPDGPAAIRLGTGRLGVAGPVPPCREGDTVGMPCPSDQIRETAGLADTCPTFPDRAQNRRCTCRGRLRGNAYCPEGPGTEAPGHREPGPRYAQHATRQDALPGARLVTRRFHVDQIPRSSRPSGRRVGSRLHLHALDIDELAI